MPHPASATVVIIDDNDVSRSMLRHILASEKHPAVLKLGAPAGR